MRKLLLILISLFIFNAFSKGQKSSLDAAQLHHQIEKLKNTTRVLYIAAHPDDENTRLIGHLTHHSKCDVAYLSLTRGGGGQNLIGTELGGALGLIRTNELLQARSIDGATQYFSRALDFGYSKTPEETFSIWDKEKILADVVWVIRQYQPDVIITRFSPEVNPDRGTHGHHTASARLAVEAFDLAAKKDAFPEQLKYVKPWTTKQLYWNTSWWFYGSKDLLKKSINKDPELYTFIEVNQHIPMLNITGSEISSHSRSQHKSQGFGSSPTLSSQPEYIKLLKGNSALKFEELCSKNWQEYNNGKLINGQIDKILKKYDFANPGGIVADLVELRKHIENIEEKALREQKLAHINELIIQSLGVRIEANSTKQFTHLGDKITGKLSIYNPSSTSISLKKWNLNKGTLAQGNTKTDGFTTTVDFTIDITNEIGISQPYWLSYPVAKGYTQITKQTEIGSPMGEYSFLSEVILKIINNEVKMSLPILYGSTDPVKGMIREPILVRPDAMLNLTNEVYFFNNGASQKIEVSVTAGKESLNGYVELNLPQGWKSDPAFFKTNFSKEGETKSFSFRVSPPQEERLESVRAIFKDGANIHGRSYEQLNYDHIDKWAMFPTAQAKIVNTNLKIKGKKVAYLPGAGDKVPESLKTMGYEVEVLDINALPSLSPSMFDAVVVGIRAYNTNPNIGSFNNLLNEYVKAGGTAIVQYNTSHRLKSKDIGPFPITLSRDRVTDETAEVRILAPNHAVLNTPNKINSADFEGWVQERGLYFPNEWDQAFTPIFGMNDAEEENKKGSLLVANYGQGHFVYTGISFFRELPAGVPGAYKLMANLISLGN